MYSLTHHSAKEAFRWSNVYSPQGLTPEQPGSRGDVFSPQGLHQLALRQACGPRDIAGRWRADEPGAGLRAQHRCIEHMVVVRMSDHYVVSTG